MSNLFCPICYLQLINSDWESDENYFQYRCKGDHCEINIKMQSNTCVSYVFDAYESPHTIVGNSKEKSMYDDFSDSTLLRQKNKIIVKINSFILINLNKPLPSQVESTTKRLLKLVPF